jgi:hypothetical protein
MTKIKGQMSNVEIEVKTEVEVKIKIKKRNPSGVRQKSLSFVCHSGLD